MEFFHKVTTYPFMHTRRMWYAVSGVAIIASIVLLFWHGLNLGIDFTGGVVLEFQYREDGGPREDPRDAGGRASLTRRSRTSATTSAASWCGCCRRRIRTSTRSARL